MTIMISEDKDPDGILWVQMTDHVLSTLVLDGWDLEDASGSEQGLNIGLCQNNSGGIGIIQY